MKRSRQTVEDILGQLSPVETTWRDEHAEAVIQLLRHLPAKATYTEADLARLLAPDSLPSGAKARAIFDTGLTAVRLFLDLSKDELIAELRNRLGVGIGVQRFQNDPEEFLAALADMGALDRMAEVVNTPLAWYDLLTERLKGGRGSAIKGQRRGRSLEDFVEQRVTKVFGEGGYEARCQFVGASGKSKEKADFAIPSKDDPSILIEAKAYGATGSKQTDVLGDVARIVEEKRDDTQFLLVTDGITWRERTSDLGKLVNLQNLGKIARIYTQSMADQLEADLRQLQREHGL